MNHDWQFELVQPDSPGWGDAVARPWVIVLSTWAPGNAQQLVQRIEDVFSAAGPHDPLPTVFVVDNVDNRDEGHWKFLTELTEAGAIVLEPENDAEHGAVQDNPPSFVRQQIVIATQTAPAAHPGAQPSPPINPHGYQEFAHAIAPLGRDELEQVIAGILPPGWQYEI